MQLVCLGTAGYHPSETRHTACFLLPQVGVVLDAGTGFFRLRDHLRTTELDIFLSHTHLDHVIGLTYWFDLIHERTLDRASVHGLADKLTAIQEHLFCEALFPVAPPYDYRPLQDAVPLAGGGVLTHFPVAHRGGSLAYRLEWPGHSLAYVTDTTATPDAPYLDFIRGVDLLLHECNFRDGQESLATLTGHSCTTPVAHVARNADVGRLLLVHLNPLETGDDPIGIEAARAIFPQTEIARDNQEFEF
jgi:ribonuclease BN (tRNA processing enzyme)